MWYGDHEAQHCVMVLEGKGRGSVQEGISGGFSLWSPLCGTSVEQMSEQTDVFRIFVEHKEN